MSQIDDEKNAIKHLLEVENDLLLKLGLQPGEEPTPAQRIQILDKLREEARRSLSERLSNACWKDAHPIDGIQKEIVASTPEEHRKFWAATYRPHVMKAKPPTLKD